MKRWNGWGDEMVVMEMPASAATYLAQKIGPGTPYPDAAFTDVVARVPPTRLPAHPLITTDPAERARHARGQSLPDWIAFRSGYIDAFPDGVAYPTSREDVRALLTFAQEHHINLIPYGGGTSVVGHINPLPSDVPILTINLSRLNALRELDEESRLATFGAGILGPDLEAALHARGYTLGHFPQSFEYASLGGWVATRSSGQQSYYYGRIEELFAGAHLETPVGPLDIHPLPASAAGPDLRHLILGSEGRLGIITDVTVRIRPLPQTESFHAAFFRDWETGVAAVRDIVQAKVPLSMLRLSDAQETEVTLTLSGKEQLLQWADRGLNLLSYGDERCLLLYGVTGDSRLTAAALRRANSLIRQHGGLPTGQTIGKIWEHSRFRNPYLRNTLWEHGYAVDTLETAVPWSAVMDTAAALKSAIAAASADAEEQVLVFAHLSHVYNDGASIYVTYLFRRNADPARTLGHWHEMKRRASQEIVAHQGTISHQHGVGMDHAPYLPAEKGPLGMSVLENVRRLFDPEGMMNPGKLLADAEEI
ncbi:MAG: FAD-binding oxidoreductase [Anaerolineales bacterium]|nr:FAD-binding oxidoreductase [Anaerolineales bacterium]MCB8950516.1 FAD-binding oxidoreductase [Ardenticatenales bacterium]